MQNEEIFELCLNILIEYYKISGHVTLMWNIVLCLNKYLFTNLYEFALKIFLISRLFIILFLGGLSLHLNHLIGSRVTNYDWPFGTLPLGLFGSNLDTRDLETYPRTYSGHF